MKDILFTALRFFIAGILIMVCVVCLFGILYYYQTAMAMVPAVVGFAAFVSSVVLVTKK